MRPFLIILMSLLVLQACVKKTSSEVIPVIEFIDFTNAKKTTNGDTAVMVLSYDDGDGDLFLVRSTQDPNLIFTTYHYDATSKTFMGTYDAVTSDTIRYSTKILRPGGINYEGEHIRGNIYIPLTQFRASGQDRILKFTGFMVDNKGHKSNTFSSPSYTLDF